MNERPGRARGPRLVRFALGLVAAGFVLFVAWDLARKFEPGRISIHWGWLLLAVLPCASAMLCQLFAWKSLVEKFSGKAMPLVPAAVVYLDSQMARYTPGKMGLVAVRVAGASELGVPARILASTLLVELASWTAVGLFVGSGTLVGLSAESSEALTARLGGTLTAVLRTGSWVLAGSALVGTILLCSLRRRHFPRWLIQLLLGPMAEEVQGSQPLAPWRLPAWHLVHWLLWVLSGTLLGLSVGVSLGAAVVVGASLCLAIVLGFLAIVAPAGAGVREAVIASLATPAVGAAAALSLGLLARGVSLLSETAVWLGVRGVHARRSR